MFYKCLICNKSYIDKCCSCTINPESLTNLDLIVPSQCIFLLISYEDDVSL